MIESHTSILNITLEINRYLKYNLYICTVRDNQHNIKTWLDELGNLVNNDSSSRCPEVHCECITIERPTTPRLKSVGVRYEKNKMHRLK